MKQSSFQISERQMMIGVLFLICTLHTMIYNFFQIPYTFMKIQVETRTIPLNVFLYSVTLITALLYPTIVRYFTLKFALMASLLCNAIGLLCIWISESLGESYPLIVVSFFFIAIASVSVFNCLVSYIVIEFPKSLTVAIVGLFIFSNLGFLIQSVMFDYLQVDGFSTIFCIIAIFFLLLSIIFISRKFFNITFPKHLVHLRRGDLIWKEMHYRLALFVLVMLCYGVVETIFAIWSFDYLALFLNSVDVDLATTLFWCFMVIGLIVLLPPIYFYSARKIFSVLIVFMIGVTFFIAQQTNSVQLMAGYIAAGFGCSIIVSVLIGFFEEEVISACSLSKIPSHLPFTEIGISLMIGGYFTGVGIMTLFVLKLEQMPQNHGVTIFHWAMFLLAVIGLISTYLNWSSADSRRK
jgi:hypothetical protein